MKIRISSVLDRGKVREKNEDALIFTPDLSLNQWSNGSMDSYLSLNQYGALTVVADGMGGANAGEVASGLAIQAVKQTFDPSKVAEAIANDEQILSLLNEAITAADNAIINRANTDFSTMGMGTTIVICWFLHDKVYIAWCGDSRCYVYNKKKLTLLTKDHSLVQEMVDNGQIAPEEAFNHPDGNIITRALGDVDGDSEPDSIVYAIQPGDTFILCTDGVCGYCNDESIQQAVSNNPADTKNVCRALFNLAMNAGGEDNIAILAVSIINEDQQESNNISLGQKLMKLIGL